jgi:hypothetical protein
MRLKLEPTNLQNSKKKLVLVAILGLAFVAVLCSSFGNSIKRADTSSSPNDKSSSPTQPVPVAVSPNVNPAALAANSTKVVEPKSRILLPEIDLNRIVARNPFVDSLKPDSALLPSTSDRQITKNTADLSHVDQALQDHSDQQPKVDAVVTGGRRPAALINNKLYFENDTVDERWVIEQILPKEVIFKLSPSNS